MVSASDIGWMIGLLLGFILGVAALATVLYTLYLVSIELGDSTLEMAVVFIGLFVIVAAAAAD